jgi:hypothetical protein
LHYELISVAEVVVYTIFPFTNFDFAYGWVSASRARVTYQARFPKSNEVGFVCMGSEFCGKGVFREDGRAAGKGAGVKTFVIDNFAGGHVAFVGAVLGKGREGFLGFVGK